MKNTVLARGFAMFAALVTPSLVASDLTLSVEVPRIDVAEYHRPYVAAWIETGERSIVRQIAVWYQQDKPAPGAAAPKGESGTKWLPDLRQWWRRGGRDLKMPVDGLSSATRPAGVHKLEFDAAALPLAAGDYRLMVEAVREEGGRELLTIPFSWPPAAAQSLDAQGGSELGAVRLQLTP